MNTYRFLERITGSKTNAQNITKTDRLQQF